MISTRARTGLGLLVLLAPSGLVAVRSRGQEAGPGGPSFRAEVREAGADQERIMKKRELCSADPDGLKAIGRAAGQQVRIYRDPADFALFTVAEARDEAPDTVIRMGRAGRLRLGSGAGFAAVVSPQGPRPGLTEDQAKALGEFVEVLDDDGTNTGLLILAPHGGAIEANTDLQAERLATALAESKQVTTWRCKGFHPNGARAAFERWHITSTDISEASFPGLAKVATRKYEYAVSFHGMTDARILVGGQAPTRLKREVQEAIRRAIDNPKIPVDIAFDGEANGGTTPTNIVNRFCRGKAGIQIEQSPDARRAHWRQIADAVARVYGPKLRSPSQR